MKPVAITPLSIADADSLAAIYGHHVLHGIGTFEEVPPPAAEMARRVGAILDRGLPALGARNDDGELLGYAWVAPYRERSGYRFTVENAIYLREEARGRGIGGLLLRALVSRCIARGDLHQVVAVIGGGQENPASVRLHERAGFRHVGELRGVGFKFGRWLDTTIMQRSLAP